MFFSIFLYSLFQESHEPRFKCYGKVEENILFFKVSHEESNGYGVAIIFHICAMPLCPESSHEWVVQLNHKRQCQLQGTIVLRFCGLPGSKTYKLHND